MLYRVILVQFAYRRRIQIKAKYNIQTTFTREELWNCQGLMWYEFNVSGVQGIYKLFSY